MSHSNEHDHKHAEGHSHGHKHGQGHSHGHHTGNHCFACHGHQKELEEATKTQPKTEHNRVGIRVLDPAGLFQNLTPAEQNAEKQEAERVTKLVTNMEGKVGAALIEIVDGVIDMDHLLQTRAMGSEACGAVSTFLGTTRDHFNGRKVLRLEYESYYTMAMAQMEKIVGEIYANYEQVHRVVISHRIGTVPVTEPSVLIAVSTEHRRSGIEAAHWAIDTLKAKVPIWKKEIYAEDESPAAEGGDGAKAKPGHSWKTNPEFSTMVAGLAKGTSQEAD